MGRGVRFSGRGRWLGRWSWLDANHDDYPTAAAATRPPVAPAARELDVDQAEALKNEVRTYLRGEGGTLQGALAVIDRVVRSYPHVGDNHALRARLLEQRGDPAALEQALRAALECGLAAPGRGAVRIGNVAQPAQRLAEHLISTQRPEEAVEVIDRAVAVLAPEHAERLFALRARAV